MFISLGARMVNDSVASCRKSAAEAITIMLGKLTKNIISTLYEITLTWLQGTKVMIKHIHYFTILTKLHKYIYRL